MEDHRATAAPPSPRDWREDVVGVAGIVVLLAMWMIVSPFMLGYQAGDASWNPIVCGVAAIGVVLAQGLRRVRSSTPGLILMAIGGWLLASSFWLADSAQASWNALGAGTLLFFLGCVAVATTQPRRSA